MYKIDLIGSDPEFFIQNLSTGKIISSTRMIPGTKDEPIDLTDILGHGFSIQKDNVLVEACVPPVKTAGEMTANIFKFRDYVNQQLFNGANELVTLASHTMDESELEDPSTREFGCSKSQNAWLEADNPKPECAENMNFRSAGGHLHISYDGANMFTNYELIKWCDALLGVPSVLLDSDMERRKLYGKAGEMRHTMFGCEYRTLSNYWVFNKEVTEFLFEQLHLAISKADVEFFSPEESLKIQTCINTNNRKLAQELCEYFNIKLTTLV